MALRRLLRLTLALPFLCPLAWLFITSLWPDGQPLSVMWLEPARYAPTLGNYSAAAALVPLGGFALNSLRVVAAAVPLTVLVASLAGFAMTRLPGREQRLLIWISLAALLAPPTALWLARFPIFKSLGWVDTLLPLIAPALIGGSPFFVLLFFWAFRRLPEGLFESAILEGASLWRVWWHIALPNAKGVVGGVAILSFVLFWGNYTDPLLYLRAESKMTLPVGIHLLAQLDITRWPVIMAGSAVLTLPVIIIFLVGQRLFRRVWISPRKLTTDN